MTSPAPWVTVLDDIGLVLARYPGVLRKRSSQPTGSHHGSPALPQGLRGGYDVVHHFRGGVSAERDRRPETYATLARHFFTTFPQLEGVRFSHAWGGAIDTSTLFCVFFDTSHRGKVAYAACFTGLGVGATRFGAEVMPDLLAGASTERTALELVRRKPLPFPPEPFRSIGIGITQRSFARADRNQGRRDLWLRTLDRLGLGFGS